MSDNLAAGGLATHLYARWLTAFLDRVDRFFGDGSMADRTLFPHAFGLKTPAPLWTAPSFDRCLWLALLYPIATVLIVWAVSGHVGPAEEALSLPGNLPGLMRGVAVMALWASPFASWQFAHTSGWTRIMWAALAVSVPIAVSVSLTVSYTSIFAGTAVAAVAFAIAFSVFGPAAVAGAFAIAVAGPYIAATAGPYILLIALYVAIYLDPAFDFNPADTDHILVSSFIGALVFAFATSIGFAFAVDWLSNRAIRKRRQGVFLLSFLVTMASGCLVAAHSSREYGLMGPLLLFLVLLTLLNAPFDWASLGVSRALLRRGLELKGWWPFVLAVSDALAAVVIIVLLALVMAVGVQAFDALVTHGNGHGVLQLVFDSNRHFALRPPLLDGIGADPEAPEYWWVYSLLLSTMIPSLINLVIGGTALMRAVPGVPPLLLRFLPETGGVPSHDRAWIAAVLTLQAALGAVLGVAVQALVAWGLIFHVMPAVGLGLLDLARSLAALDLPMQLIELLAGAL